MGISQETALQKHDKNNIKENENRIKYERTVGDLFCVVKDQDELSKERKLDKPTEGPHAILIVHSNAEVTIQRGDHSERISVRRLKPHKNH